MLKSAWKIAIKTKPIYMVFLILPLLVGCIMEIPTQGALITENDAQSHPFISETLYAINKNKDGSVGIKKAILFKPLESTPHDYELSMLNKEGSIQQRLSPVRFLGLTNGFYLMSFPNRKNIPGHWVHRIFHYEDGDLGVINAKSEDFTEFMKQNAKELAQWTPGEDPFLIIENREKVLEQINIFVLAHQDRLLYTKKAFDKKGMERFMAKNKP